MSDFESDDIRQMHETPYYAAEQAPPQLADHEIFRELFEAQAELGKHEIERDEAHEFWQEHRHIADALTTKARQAKLLSKQVTVVGEEIEIFEKTMSVVDKRTIVKPLSEEERIEACMKSTMRPNAYTGPFNGFGLGFAKKYADTGGELFTPVLEYQLRDRTNWITQNASFTVSSTAPVTTTHIIFEEDLRLIERQKILDTLHFLAPISKNYIRLLDLSLSKSPLSSSDFRHVTYYTNEIISANSAEITALLEDGICDLIKYHLNQFNNYSIRSNVHLKNDNNELGIKKLRVEDRTHTSPIQDVVFLDDHPFMPREDDLEVDRSIYFIVGDGEQGDFSYIPITGLREFTKK